MLTSIDDYLVYFDGIHSRTLRDVQALPATASGWAPLTGEGEGAWTVNRLIGHLATTRGYFVRAYRGEGWCSPDDPDTRDHSRWPVVIEESAAAVRDGLAGTPDAWLQRKIQRLASDELISGWQLLMMMTEHEVHHRSQLDTYAGLNDWQPPQIFGRRWEQVLELQAEERAR